MINQYIKKNNNIYIFIKNNMIKNKIILNNNQIFIIINAIKFYNYYKISPSIKMLIFFIKKKFGIKYGNIKYINDNFNNIKLIYIISNLKINKNCFI